MHKKLSKNIVVYGLTNMIKSLVPFIMLPLLTEYLTKEEFGILSLIETTILFLTPLILLNIGAAIKVEYFKVKQQVLSSYITNAFMLSFISFFIFLLIFSFFYKIIYTWIPIDKNLFIMLPLFAFLRVASTVTLVIYQAREEAKKFFLFTLFQTLVDFGLSYLFVVWLKYGYIGRLEGIYIAFFIASAIGVYLLIKMQYIVKINFYHTKEILKFGIPLIPHALGGTIIAMSDRYFISYYAGNEEVGLYVVAYQIAALMLLVGVSVNQAWSPMFFKMLQSRRYDKVQIYIYYLMILFIFIGIILYFIKDILFDLLVHQEFYEAKAFFGYLLLGFLFQSLYFLVTNLLFFEKRTALISGITVLGALLNMVLNYVLIQAYGTIGVAYATAITWGIFFLCVLAINIKLRKAYIL